MIVALVSCGSRKRTTPCAARDLYTSPLFRLSRAVAERHATVWAILSAKYGLVQPTRVLPPYSLSLGELDDEARSAWVLRTRTAIVSAWPGATYLILAGPLYEAVVDGLPHHAPLRGLRIGKRLQALRRML